MVTFTSEIVSSKPGAVGRPKAPSMLVKFSERLQDWRGFWARIFIPIYIDDVQQNFETEGELSTPGGWPSLEAPYAAWKARHFPGTKILERTRRLRESLSLSGVGGRDQLLEARPTALRFGTKVPYARFHLTHRPFMPPVENEKWHPIIERYVEAVQKETGLT